MGVMISKYPQVVAKVNWLILSTLESSLAIYSCGCQPFTKATSSIVRELGILSLGA